MGVSSALDYARRQGGRFVGELQEFVRIPSVSAEPRHTADVWRCAAWLANQLREVGLDSVKTVATPRHPIVFGEWKHAPHRATVLIYGHYDVLPVEPLKEWRLPPFQAVVHGGDLHGGDLYGRGACDDKGQLFTHVKALEAYLRTDRAVPVNVKCLFEGEEEIDSPHLGRFLAKNKRALKADLALISDSRMLAPNKPAIGYSQRGTLRLELEVCGPGHDLHSGNFGGAVHNPLQALCEIIAGLHDSRGRIAIPGFYERVRGGSGIERASMKRRGPSDQRILSDAEVEMGWGEDGYSVYERTTVRPALTVNGLAGGHQGTGAKAVIPARALAKLSFRLVPDQDPGEVDRLFRSHVARVTPPTVHAAVRTVSSAKPAFVDPNHPFLKAAVLAYTKGFGARPTFLRSGGSIPAVSMFQEILGIPTVLMGFALPDDGMHAPNEKFHLPNFHQGIAASIWFLRAAAALHGAHGRLHQTAEERTLAYDH